MWLFSSSFCCQYKGKVSELSLVPLCCYITKLLPRETLEERQCQNMYSFPTVESALLFVSYLDKNRNNLTLKGTRKKKHLQKLGHTSVSHTSSSFSFCSGISLRAGSLMVDFYCYVNFTSVRA